MMTAKQQEIQNLRDIVAKIANDSMLREFRKIKQAVKIRIRDPKKKLITLFNEYSVVTNTKNLLPKLNNNINIVVPISVKTGLG